MSYPCAAKPVLSFRLLLPFFSQTVASSHTHTQNNVLDLFFLMQNWIARNTKVYSSLLTSGWTTETPSCWHLSIAPCTVCDPVFTCLRMCESQLKELLTKPSEHYWQRKNWAKTCLHTHRLFSQLLKTKKKRKNSRLNLSVFPNRSSNLHHTAAPSSLSPPLLIRMTHRQWAWQHRSPCCRSGAPEAGGYRLCW